MMTPEYSFWSLQSTVKHSQKGMRKHSRWKSRGHHAIFTAFLSTYKLQEICRMTLWRLERLFSHSFSGESGLTVSRYIKHAFYSITVHGTTVKSLCVNEPSHTLIQRSNAEQTLFRSVCVPGSLTPLQNINMEYSDDSAGIWFTFSLALQHQPNGYCMATGIARAQIPLLKSLKINST